MNKKETNLILTGYKVEYSSYLNGFLDIHNLNRIRDIIKLVIDDNSIKDVENGVILENSEYMLNTWNDICDYVNKKLIINTNNLEFVKDEIQFTSENETQYIARLENIKQFETRLFNKNIKLM